MAQAPNDPIGIGIAYPIQFHNGGMRLTASTYITTSGSSGIGPGASTRRVLAANVEEKKNVIKQAIRRIILTRQGARFMRGEVGSVVDRIEFETNEPHNQALVLAYGNSAVQLQEERVTVMEAQAIEDVDSPSEEVTIGGRLNYRIRGTEITDEVKFRGGEVIR